MVGVLVVVHRASDVYYFHITVHPVLCYSLHNNNSDSAGCEANHRVFNINTLVSTVTAHSTGLAWRTVQIKRCSCIAVDVFV